MAEEIQKKKISDLPSAVYLSDEDVMPVVQGSGSSEATNKVDIGLLGSTVAESKTFSNLDTTSKTLVGAINEVNSSLGNVPSADEISYDNTSSGLSASDVQGAIDEIAQGSGGSTVTVTQIQDTGTRIATITVDSVDTDLYAPNGGGGASAFEDLTDVDIDSSTLANGQVPVYNSTSEKWENGTISSGSGHTILDDEGTSLTQRDDLQFKGAYSEDDSTSEKTVVNVARTMTLAEFEQLTDAEKAGFINVKDETSGSDDKFQPVIYSEDEREIGVWVNGKPIYQMSWVFSTPIDIQNNSWVLTSIDCSTIDDIVKVESVTGSGSNISIFASKNATNNVIELQTPRNQYTTNCGKLTLWYTKTTDTAGSGQWTPQGVPAHHYSEDEQIVGTWIDGKTLYEKTVYISSLPNGISVEYETGLSNITPISFDNILIFPSGNTSKAPYLNMNGTVYIAAQFNANGKIYFGANTDQSSTSAYVTLRYTKSST